MRNYLELLQKINMILTDIKHTRLKKNKKNLINQNKEHFENLLKNMDDLCQLYQFRDKNTPNQSIVQGLFFKVINSVLGLGKLWIDTSAETDFIRSIVEKIDKYEKKYCEELSVENISEKLASINSYMKHNGMRQQFQKSLNREFKKSKKDIYSNDIRIFLVNDDNMFKSSLLIKLTSFIAENYSEIQEETLKTILNHCENIVAEILPNSNSNVEMRIRSIY